MPQVSIIMPAYNRADTIRRAVQSAQAQTFRDWELIIVDDGSTDGTASLVPGDDPQIVLIRQENRGFVGARNTGLQAARGSYIAFLDSDDEWMPHHLELCIAFLEAFPEERFVATELLEDFGGGRRVNHYDDLFWMPHPADAQLRAIRSLMQLDIAQVALKAGQRARAMEARRAARVGLPRFWAPSRYNGLPRACIRHRAR